MNQQFFYIAILIIISACEENPKTQNLDPIAIDQSFSILEHSPKGTIVGNIIAEDPNENQVLSYEILSGNQLGIFRISQTGELEVDDPLGLNYELNSSYELKVGISDNFKTPARIEVLIDVLVENVYLSEPIVHYPLDGNTEEIRKGNNGELYGSPQAVEDRNGILNSALLFNGETDYAILPHDDEIDFGPDEDFSISLWLNAPIEQLDLESERNYIISKRNIRNAFPYDIVLYNSNSALYENSLSLRRSVRNGSKST